LIDSAEMFLDRQMKWAVPAAPLARLIGDAAATRRWHARYVAPVSAKGLVAVLTRASDRLADVAKRRAIIRIA
jgi:hypothetical protein